MPLFSVNFLNFKDPLILSAWFFTDFKIYGSKASAEEPRVLVAGYFDSLAESCGIVSRASDAPKVLVWRSLYKNDCL